jgi:hypothetical protein
MDEGDVNQDLKDLLSRKHREMDHDSMLVMAEFRGPLDWALAGETKAPGLPDSRDLETEEEQMDFKALHERQWVSELFSLLDECDGLRWWPGAVPENRSLLAHVETMHSNVRHFREQALESWRNNSPNHKFIKRLRQHGATFGGGTVNPITGWPLRFGQTQDSVVAEEWNISCFKRAYTMTHIDLLEETESMLEDMVRQEQLANCLKDLQMIVDAKMSREEPDGWMEHIFFQTAMATLVLQWELNFRKESLKMDLTHLIDRLEKINEALDSIDYNGTPNDRQQKDGHVHCCRSLNTAQGCSKDSPVTDEEEERILHGVLHFTTQQQIPLLQNSLRRTLILEEIFQRLSSQILFKMTTFPCLKKKDIIPLDFNMDRFMERTSLQGPTIPRCRAILARIAGRASQQGCFGCTRSCLTKDFERF